MRAYIYKITLNNGKSYIGMKISEKINKEYMGSSFNKAYWSDLERCGIESYVILEEGNYEKRSHIEDVEGKYIKNNGLWPETYNYYYKEGNQFIKSLDKFDTLSKEDLIEYHRNYKKIHREKILEQNREYKKRNYEKILEQNREYHKKNKDILSIKHKEYHLANKEKINNRTREWYLKNKDEYNRRRREKRLKEKSLKESN